ncbi:MAG: glycosyltransferase family 39 protein [Acidobacteriota bacterium]|nr:glycosyltransferase family 39 protein [Acidobacteriota bacterium]
MRLSPVAEWLVLALAVIYVVLTLLPCISTPPGRDQGTYLTVGNSLLHGKVLYRDIWDNKPPAIFYVSAAVGAVFGRVFWSPAAMDILLAALGCLLLYRLVRPLLGVFGASVALILYAAWHSRFMYYWIAQPEMYQGVCALGICLLLRWQGIHWRLRYVLAGLLMAFAFLLKYTFAVAVPFLLLMALLDMEQLGARPPRLALRASWRECLLRCGVVLGACAAAVLLAIAGLAVQGAWPAFYESQFVVLPRYAAEAVKYEPHYLRLALIRLGGVLPPFVLGPLAAAAILAYFRRNLPRFMPLLLAAFAVLSTAVVQVRFHDYYFTGCYPFLAAAGGYTAVALLELLQQGADALRRRGLRVAVVLLWVAVLNFCFLPLPDEYVRELLRYHQLSLWCKSPAVSYASYPGAISVEFLDGQIEVLDYLRQNARPEDKVFLWGSNSLVYFISGHEPPTRFPLNLGLISRWSPPEWLPEAAQQVERAAPTYFIVTRGDQLRTITYSDLDSEQFLQSFPALRDYLAQEYVPVRHMKNFEIYRRRDAGTPQERVPQIP